MGGYLVEMHPDSAARSAEPECALSKYQGVVGGIISGCVHYCTLQNEMRTRGS